MTTQTQNPAYRRASLPQAARYNGVLDKIVFDKIVLDEIVLAKNDPAELR